MRNLGEEEQNERLHELFDHIDANGNELLDPTELTQGWVLIFPSRDRLKNKNDGDSDVGDFMMVTDLRCCWQNHYVGDFFRYVVDFLNVLNRSPKS